MPDPTLLGSPAPPPTSSYSQPSGFLPAVPVPHVAAPTTAPTGEMPWDTLGRQLFGTAAQPSPLGSVPGVKLAQDVLGNIGHVTGEISGKPYAIAEAALSRIPLGWLPGGADEGFRQIGEFAKANDPVVYKQWLEADAAAAQDFLYGGNIKADFNRETITHYADLTKQGFTGLGAVSPDLALGRGGVGSVGGALAHAITGFLGIGTQVSQRLLAGSGAFDPAGPVATGLKGAAASTPVLGALVGAAEMLGGTNAAQVGDRAGTPLMNRLQESMFRFDNGLPVSDVEKHAIEQVRSGAWSEDHALNYLVTAGQGVTRNPVGQLVGAAALDPLLYATIGAGAVAGAGKAGAGVAGRIAEGGLAAQTNYEKLALAVHGIGQTNLGPIFRVARGLIDPLGVYVPKGSVTSNLIDLTAGAATKSVERAVGAGAIDDAQALARSIGKATEVDQAIAGFGVDQASLLVAREARAIDLINGLGEDLVHTDPNDVIAPLMRGESRDVINRLTDSVYRNLKNWWTPSDERQMVGRLAASFGQDTSFWADKFARMSNDAKSLWHAIVYRESDKAFTEAMSQVDRGTYHGSVPLGQLAITSDSTIDTVLAKDLLQQIDEAPSIATKTALWNDAERRWSAIADIGHATESQTAIDDLTRALQKAIDEHGIMQRVTDEELAHPALAPLRDFLDRYTIDGERLWNLGFRPHESVAWGLKRNAITGRLVIERDPTILHYFGEIPTSQSFTDVTRNIVGQIVGPRTAETITKPLDTLSSFISTSADQVSGRRLVLNIGRRFEKSMVEEVGVPAKVANEIFSKARDVVGLDRTTIRGIQPQNLWAAIEDTVKSYTTLAGKPLDVRTVMDHLLTASEGDLRIMGLTSFLTQRMRNIMRAANIPLVGGDTNNWMGMMTVTMYNKLRYAQPVFVIQRITDAPYFMALRGVMPTGGKLARGLEDVRAIEDMMGRTGTARDFAMDMPEYALRSNFTQGLERKMGMFGSRIADIQNATDNYIASNMTKDLSSRLGDIVAETLDEVPAQIERIAVDNPEMAAAMRADLAGVLKTFDEINAQYSLSAGRVLDRNELGLKYIQEMMGSQRRLRVGPDGVDLQGLIHEGEWSTPKNIGEIPPIRPDALAQELGYKGDNAGIQMWRDIHGTYDKAGVHTPGTHDIDWLKERLGMKPGIDGFTPHIDKDYAQRAVDYFSDSWDGFWRDSMQSVEKGGRGFDPYWAKKAQDLIAVWARDNGMDPWEYLSQIMTTNLGGTPSEATGALMSFLKQERKPLESWTEAFKSQSQPSQQALLADALAKYEKELPRLIQEATDAGDIARAQRLNVLAGELRGGTAESGGAVQGGAADSAWFAQAIRDRVASGVADPNPEVEAAFQHFSKWVQSTAKELRQAEVETELKDVMKRIPTVDASAYNRTEGWVQKLLRDKINIAQDDVFMQAEMATNRSVFMRSLNHPLFGLYPASYMWGKVLPLTAQFLARNPFAASYTIANVQRSIATQREYDPAFAKAAGDFDTGAIAFLAGYLTPSLPWEDIQASPSPLARNILKGKDLGTLLSSELDTVSPERWFRSFAEAASQAVEFGQGQVGAASAAPAPAPTTGPAQMVAPIVNQPATPSSPAATSAPSLSVPTPAAHLAPVLTYEMEQLQKALQ